MKTFAATCRLAVGAEREREVARTAGEHIALAIGNLRLREQLRLQAIRDPLTGLFNRRFMEEALEREIQRAAPFGSPLAVILLDLDHFKQINDGHGHGTADLVLQAFGAVVTRILRAGDMGCRFGGDEFLIILPDADLTVAQAVARDIVEAVRRLPQAHPGRLPERLSASSGVAAFPLHGATPAALLRAADEALYLAKERGRDQVAVSQSDDPDRLAASSHAG